jgi:hypothetical protein
MNSIIFEDLTEEDKRELVMLRYNQKYNKKGRGERKDRLNELIELIETVKTSIISYCRHDDKYWFTESYEKQIITNPNCNCSKLFSLKEFNKLLIEFNRFIIIYGSIDICSGRIIVSPYEGEKMIHEDYLHGFHFTQFDNEFKKNKRVLYVRSGEIDYSNLILVSERIGHNNFSLSYLGSIIPNREVRELQEKVNLLEKQMQDFHKLYDKCKTITVCPDCNILKKDDSYDAHIYSSSD